MVAGVQHAAQEGEWIQVKVTHQKNPWSLVYWFGNQKGGKDDEDDFDDGKKGGDNKDVGKRKVERLKRIIRLKGRTK